jgi:hypothetical protein
MSVTAGSEIFGIGSVGTYETAGISTGSVASAGTTLAISETAPETRSAVVGFVRDIVLRRAWMAFRTGVSKSTRALALRGDGVCLFANL